MKRQDWRALKDSFERKAPPTFGLPQKCWSGSKGSDESVAGTYLRGHKPTRKRTVNENRSVTITRELPAPKMAQMDILPFPKR